MRIAWADDADAIAARPGRGPGAEQYADLLPAEALPDDPADLAARPGARSLTRPADARNRVLVALERNRVVGFAVTDPGRRPRLRPGRRRRAGRAGRSTPASSARGTAAGCCRRRPTPCVADRFTRAVTWTLATDDARRAFLTERRLGAPTPRTASSTSTAPAPPRSSRCACTPPWSDRSDRATPRRARDRRATASASAWRPAPTACPSAPSRVASGLDVCRPARCRCWSSPAPRSSRWSACSPPAARRWPEPLTALLLGTRNTLYGLRLAPLLAYRGLAARRRRAPGDRRVDGDVGDRAPPGRRAARVRGDRRHRVFVLWNAATLARRARGHGDRRPARPTGSTRLSGQRSWRCCGPGSTVRCPGSSRCSPRRVALGAVPLTAAGVPVLVAGGVAVARRRRSPHAPRPGSTS